MEPRGWDEVKRLFDEAGALPREQRSALLATAETAVRVEVESLLIANERAGCFLASGSAGLGESGDSLLGQRLGPYEITGLLGRGGMGVVYLARREAPTRIVAIKVVPPGAESAEALRRIRAEAEILARLEHPHIARLLDAGTTAEGRPCVVMEYVDGQTLEGFCAEHRPDLGRRLKLFATLCDAVAYAHGRLVVHRDIKPANVLVTPTGEPKLLDFGIGKLLDEGPLEIHTGTGLRLMTPEYASPEQIRGEPVTVATDVHALGLLLYTLLTGAGPFRLRTSSPEELVRVICLEEPARPSQAVISQRAALAFEPPESSQRLARLLRGDLDAIVGQALRKEPEKRYASVEQMADDVRRYLEGRPVRAQRATLSYRLRRFVERNRWGVAAASAVFLTLLAGVATTSWQARAARVERARAERRFSDVRQLAHAMLFQLHDKIRDLPGSTEAREFLVTQALQYLDSLAAEAGGDPGLQRELATAYRRVADVQGQPGGANLGDEKGAMRSYNKALALYVPLSEAAPRDAALQLDRVGCQYNIGRLEEDAGDLDAAAASMGATVELTRKAAAARPDNVRLQDSLVHSEGSLGNIQLYRGDLTSATTTFRRAVARAEAACAKRPADPDLRGGLAYAYANLARALREARDFRGAMDLYGKARAIYEPQEAAQPLNARAQQGLALVWLESGNVLADMLLWSDAAASGRRASAITKAQVEADPGNAVPRRMLPAEEILLCRAETQATRRLSESCSRAIGLSRAVAAAGPGRAQLGLIEAHGVLGSALCDLGDLPRAIVAFQEEVSLADTLVHARPADARVRMFAAEGHAGTGRALAGQGEWAKALEEYRASAVLREPPAGLGTPKAQAELFDLYCSMGAAHENRHAWLEARDSYRQALDLLERASAQGAFPEGSTTELERARRGLATSEAALSRTPWPAGRE